MMLQLPQVALSTARSIARGIKNASRLIARDMQNASKPLLSQEDATTQLSAVMVQFLPQIKTLAKEGPGTSLLSEQALHYAYDLMLLLKTESYLEKGSTLPVVHRPSDEPADRLLAAIIIKRRERRQTWDWEGDLQVLECERALVWAHNKDAWYPATRRQLLLSCRSS